MPVSSRRSNQAPRPLWRRPPLLGGAVLWVLALAAAATYFMSGLQNVARPPTSTAQVGGPFSLIGPTGGPVADRDFRGKFLLVYFGYTHCPDVCPTTLEEVAAALQSLGPRAARVQPIFITVDPRRDTPGIVGPYAAHFSRQILGLTGSPAQIAAVERAYNVYASPESTPEQLDAAIDHSSVLYLMGPDGSFIAPVRIDAGPARLAVDVARHLQAP